MTFGLTAAWSLRELYFILLQGNYFFVDFGRWFFCLDLIDSNLTFCIDTLALVASILVLVLTMFALYFGVEYMYREAFINRLLYLLNLFATSVVFLFYCYDFFLILFAWECIGLFSFLLVNFYSTRIYTIKAALKTFILSRISDMFMFFSFLLTVNTYCTTDLSLIFLQTPFLTFHYLFLGETAWHFLTVFSFCLTTSGAIKAAQFFFHVWLPDAMEAPTPASALIHSSTLVVAGVFLILRFSILFEFAILTNYYLILLGALTLSFGAVTATFQNDIKKLVAYSTISQIGYLICGCGFCCYEEVLIYLIIHALNKAFLFVLVGYVVHFFSGNTDMRQMGGAYLYSFDLTVLLFGVCFNLAGLPYSAGFLGKEFLLFQVLRDDFISLFVRGCWLVSFFFTPIYMFTLVFLVMFGPKKGSVTSYTSSWYFKFNSYMHQLVLARTCTTQALSVSWRKTFLSFGAANLFSLKRFTSNTNKLSTPYLSLSESLISKLQFTVITSRSTTYLLLLFWLGFFHFGETLLLIIFNYSVTVDSINSSSFMLIKQHVPYSLNSVSTKLLSQISFFISFLTPLAFTYLLCLGYSSKYKFFWYSSLSNYVLLSAIIITLLNIFCY
jgi:NADH:ubiquinone oxidoreductase subunit 5 (subunit L)/multisubunit Na+/H+ antiporter MnhA subunit